VPLEFVLIAATRDLARGANATIFGPLADVNNVPAPVLYDGYGQPFSRRLSGGDAGDEGEGEGREVEHAIAASSLAFPAAQSTLRWT
jgi:hypothetical protein